MALPSKHDATNSTANGTDQVTTTAINVSAGDLISIVCETAEGVQSPSVRLHNTAGSMVTEDETIGAAADGVILYRETVTSFTRTTTSSSGTPGAAVNTTAAVASDVGLRISDAGGHIAAGSVIVTSTPGVGYALSKNLNSTLPTSSTITLSSDVAADQAEGDATNGKVWKWSILVDPSSTSLTTVQVLINWGPIAGARRYRIVTSSPGSGNVPPLRANRVLARYKLTGAAGGTGAFTLTRDVNNNPTTQPCVGIGCDRAGSGSASTITFDWDGNGSFETTSSAGNNGGRTLQASTPVCTFIDGWWAGDGSDTFGVPGVSPALNTTVSQGATTVRTAIVYAMAAAPIKLTITDNLGLTDSRSMGLNRVLTEHENWTDTASTGTPIAISLSNNLGFTDTTRKALTYGLTDNLGLTDSGIVNDHGELVNFTDSIVVHIPGTIPFTDNLGLSDSISVNVHGPILLTVNDAIGWEDFESITGVGHATSGFFAFMG